MSIKLMQAVYDSDLEKGQKAIALAMADFANDDGVGIYASVDRISWKTGYGERQTRILISELKALRILIYVGRHKGSRTNEYQMMIDNLPSRPPFSSTRKPAVSAGHNHSNRQSLPVPAEPNRQSVPVKPAVSATKPLVNRKEQDQPLEKRKEKDAAVSEKFQMRQLLQACGISIGKGSEIIGSGIPLDSVTRWVHYFQACDRQLVADPKTGRFQRFPTGHLVQALICHDPPPPARCSECLNVLDAASNCAICAVAVR